MNGIPGSAGGIPSSTELIDGKPHFTYKTPMTKEKLIEIIKRVLNTDADLSFLLQLKKTELETLVACIRNQVEN